MLHLCERFPQAGLAPPPGSDARSEFYKWLVWLSSSLQAMMPHYFYSDRMVAPGDAAGAAAVKAQAEAKIEALVDQLDARLSTRPWMLGEHFGALDPYVFMLCRWTRGMQRPARTLPHLGPWLQAMLQRPSVGAVLEAEGLPSPWV